MATYKSNVTSLAAPAERVYAKLSNLEGLGELIKNVPADKVPADKRALMEQISITPSTISFPGGPVGEVTLELARLEEPSLIELKGKGTPVPLELALHIRPLTADTCEAYVEINIQIPAMLKPMVNGPLQKMADEFGQVLRAVPLD